MFKSPAELSKVTEAAAAASKAEPKVEENI
jgi:hypothetical protein